MSNTHTAAAAVNMMVVFGRVCDDRLTAPSLANGPELNGGFEIDGPELEGLRVVA